MSFSQKHFMINFAFSDDVKGWNADPNAYSIDLLDSGFNENVVSNMKKLQRFRAMRCHCTNLTFSNLPQLEVIDLSLCMELESLTIIKCPKLKALELSYCAKLFELNGDYPSLRYLSCPSTLLSSIPKAPNLLYLNIDWCNNLSNFDIFQYKKLMRIHMCSTDAPEFKLSELSNHPSLTAFEAQYCVVHFDEYNRKSKLKYINLFKSQFDGDIEVCPKDCFIQLPDLTCKGELINEQIKEVEAVQMLFYGPWGVPPSERVNPTIPKPIFTPPSCNLKDASDSIAGAIFGSAIMDMIGLGVEFEFRGTAKMRLLGPLSITWSHPWLTEHTTSFIRGTSTDDTSQAILIMRSLIQAQMEDAKHTKLFKKSGVCNIDIGDFAERMKDWMLHGHEEHKDGRGLGLGKTTKQVLTNPNFLEDPQKCARDVWEEHGKNVASNGAVMRTGPVGCFCFWDDETVITNAKEFAKVTHADPRCVFSSVCVSLLVSRIIRFLSGISSSFDVDETINDAINVVEDIEPFKDEILQYSNYQNISDINLSENGLIGYTLKTYGAGIWALKHSASFEDALIQVIKEGGDADTNGAVVGALIGAINGFSAIPDYLLKYMYNGKWIYNEMCKFMGLMGLEPPPYSW